MSFDRDVRVAGRLVVAVALVAVAGCADVQETAKLVPSDATDNDNFGYSVSIAGDSAVVGVLRDDDDGIDAGAAYAFRLTPSGWVQEAKLDPIGNGADDQFGSTVAIDGDTIVVGASGDDGSGTGSGAAYVFHRVGSSWSQQAKLTASDASMIDRFGNAVAVSGDTVVVGAENAGDVGNSPGAAYVFARSGSTWTEQAKLTASDGADRDRFGFSVAVSGATAVVGAMEHDDGASAAGAAWVFERSGAGWTQSAKLNPPGASIGRDFGLDVAIAGDTILVGAHHDDVAAPAAGAGYVFVRSGAGWTQQAVLTASDAAQGDSFGWSVSVSGNVAVLGRNIAQILGGHGPGAAYVFRRSGTTWSQEAKLPPPSGTDDDFFGFASAVSGESVLVGAWQDDAAGHNAGAAYVYTPSGSTWAVQARLEAVGASAQDNFGISVAVSRDRAVVGALRDDNQFDGLDSGSAYVYARQGGQWSQQAKLTASDAAPGDTFGESVAIDVDTIVVGAANNDAVASNAGAAYVYVFDGSAWSQQAKLTASDGAAVDLLGNSAALAGDTIVLGALGDDDHGGESGAAYVFTRAGASWSEQAKLTASDGASGDGFGFTVAVSGDRAVVGAPSSGGSARGAAYVFERSGAAWTQVARLTPADAANAHFFGWSVDVTADRIVVGAPGDAHAGQGAGAAYVFEGSGATWTQRCKLTALDADADHSFGWSVAVEGATVIVGARGDDAKGLAAGAAFDFELGATDCIESQHRLIGSDTVARDTLGIAVAVSSGTIVVGATGDGSAYVFEDR